MPNYINTSKFYKILTINGKRIPVPPNKTVFSPEELNLEIHDYLKLSDDTTQPYVPTVKDKPKIKVVDKDQYEKLEQAIISLHKHIKEITTLSENDVNVLIKKYLDSTPTIEEEELQRLAKNLKDLEENINSQPINTLITDINEMKDLFNTIDRRQHVLKNAIDEVNEAVINLEKLVYENDWDPNPIVVVDDNDNDDIINEENDDDNYISLDDIIQGG